MANDECPVCGETRVDHVREYVINGRQVRMGFSACLHTPEELEAARAAADDEPIHPDDLGAKR